MQIQFNLVIIIYGVVQAPIIKMHSSYSTLNCVLQFIYLISVLSLVHCGNATFNLVWYCNYASSYAAVLLVVEWQHWKTGSVTTSVPLWSLETSSTVSSTAGWSPLRLCSWMCIIGTFYCVFLWLISGLACTYWESVIMDMMKNT